MAMRLTLRTLLAYLDDTLEPNAAKLIGQKVAESDTAQELIARIKEVTRRRRITTPGPGGPGAKVDPNSIAAYLDNELSDEALAEVEQLALASDVHLAEIAACHQILTIVLGEPAMVPPTAYQRMYSLVKPPESNPQHQPPVVKETEEALFEGKEVDETLRLGLPAFQGRGSWSNRLVLGGGAVCVLALLCVAIWQLLPPQPAHEGEGNGGAFAKAEGGNKPPSGKDIEPKGPAAKVESETAPKKDAEPNKEPPKDKGKTSEAKDNLPPPKEEKPAGKDKKAEDEPPAPPLEVVKEVGHFEPPPPPGAAVLLQLLPDKKQPDRKHWTRLLRTKDPTQAQVLSNAPLLSLPGYRSVVVLNSGVRLTLWGNVPEISPFAPFAFESLVTLHPNDQFDLDLTLSRGRIAVANLKDQPVKVRVRFANPTDPGKPEVWDFKLQEKGTEVVVSQFGFHPPGEQFVPNKNDPKRKDPVAVVWAVVKSGKADLRRDWQAFDKLVPPPAGAQVIWNSRIGPREFKAEASPPWTQFEPPLPKEVDKMRVEVLSALASLNGDLTGQSVDVGLEKANETNNIPKRRLVVRCAGAMDDWKRVIDALADKEVDVRRVAIETLRVEIGADRDNDYKLHEQLQSVYSQSDGTIIMTLLHRWAPADAAEDGRIRNLLVDYLTHDKLAIRELAHDYLLSLPGLYQAGAKIGYNAAGAPADYHQRAKQWRALVQQGEKK